MKIELQENGQLKPESELFLKQVAVQFFYYWYNTPGNNTRQGFEDWIKADGLQYIKEVLKDEPVEKYGITPEALKANGFEEKDPSTFTKDGFEVWKMKVGPYQLNRKEPFLLVACNTMPELLKLMEVHAVKDAPSVFPEMEHGLKMEDEAFKKVPENFLLPPVVTIKQAPLNLDISEPEENKRAKIKDEFIMVYRGPSGTITDQATEQPEKVPFIGDHVAFYCYHHEAIPGEICVKQCEQCQAFTENMQKSIEKASKYIEKGR